MQVLLADKVVDTDRLPYRQGVIGIVIDDHANFLIVQMVEYGQNDWRFAGGGVDEDETPQEALLRELKEELGSQEFEILKQSAFVNTYDWPGLVITKRFKKRGVTHRGQQQSQFLVRFTGDPKSLQPDPRELRRIKWVRYSELERHFQFPNQWEQAKRTIKELMNI